MEVEVGGMNEVSRSRLRMMDGCPQSISILAWHFLKCGAHAPRDADVDADADADAGMEMHIMH